MFTKRFDELNKDMFQECGGKAAHLGELSSLKLNVPNGFNVLGHAFYHHLKKNALEDQVSAIAEKINYDDYQDLEEKTKKIRDLIVNAPIPPEIEEEIIENYERLSNGQQEAFVAVRSSVAVKDSSVSSFPGMMDTFHYIQGAERVVEKVKECWASVWSSRAAFSRHTKGIEHTKAIIAPTIQLMVNSEVAGVLFTINPITGSKDDIVIEANWGLGESVVCGKCLCDFYTADKNLLCIKVKKIAKKRQTYAQSEKGGADWVEVEPEKVNMPTLTEAQVEELCRVACLIEGHYGFPQDIEWAYEKGVLYILQARRAKTGVDECEPR
jgi:pyruvate,water dikinase